MFIPASAHLPRLFNHLRNLVIVRNGISGGQEWRGTPRTHDGENARFGAVSPFAIRRRRLLRVLRRVDGDVVESHFVVAVRSGRAAGRSDLADLLPAVDPIARLDADLRE